MSDSTQRAAPDPDGLADDQRAAREQGPPAFTGERYELEESLGKGGMGVVYRAYDRELCRQVALKVTRHEVDAERFLEEARVTAQLEHPAIIPVYDLGRTVDGRLYYTMRLVTGLTLAEVVVEEDTALFGELPTAPTAWSFPRLLAVLVTVCRAVEYAHQRGVLHRDLKPGNVMVGSFGGVYVLDWGLAKVLDREQVELGLERSATQVGHVVGTPVFMAPEQAAGESLGPPADVFALGGILYLLLTGAAPREGAPSVVWKQIAARTLPPEPRKLDPRVPEELNRLCLEALAAEPEARPTAAALADGLLRHLEGG